MQATHKLKTVKFDLISIDNFDIETVAKTLTNGQIILYPTETVYGLGVNIYREDALKKLSELKGRQSDKPFSCMISSPKDLNTLCKTVPLYVEKLIETFWPGPVTFVLKADDSVPRSVVSSQSKIGLRYPSHPLTRVLMQVHPQPVVSTSANFIGQPAPVTFDDVSEELLNKIDLVIDAGACKWRCPSTVVDVSETEPVLLREGAIPFAKIIQCFEGA